MICTKTIDLVVTSCIDPDTILWNAVLIDFPPNSSAVGTPNGAPGATFDAHISSGFNIQATVNLTGTITYNGPGCNLSFDGNMIRSGPGGYSYYGLMRVDVIIGMVTTSTILIMCAPFVPPGIVQMNTGPFSIPFSIPNTGGLDATVDIHVDLDFNLAGGPYNLQITGTVSTA